MNPTWFMYLNRYNYVVNTFWLYCCTKGRPFDLQQNWYQQCWRYDFKWLFFKNDVGRAESKQAMWQNHSLAQKEIDSKFWQ